MTEARISDPQVLRALAHPLRGRLLGLLRLDGPSTASRLAERVGESSGATSYHLRQLAAYGMVVELMQRHQIEVMGRELRSWVDGGRVHGPDWAGVAGLSDYVLRLTPAETRQVLEEVYAVLDGWAARTHDPRPGTLPVNVFTAAFPRTP